MAAPRHCFTKIPVPSGWGPTMVTKHWHSRLFPFATPCQGWRQIFGRGVIRLLDRRMHPNHLFFASCFVINDLIKPAPSAKWINFFSLLTPPPCCLEASLESENHPWAENKLQMPQASCLLTMELPFTGDKKECEISRVVWRFALNLRARRESKTRECVLVF